MKQVLPRLSGSQTASPSRKMSPTRNPQQLLQSPSAASASQNKRNSHSTSVLQSDQTKQQSQQSNNGPSHNNNINSAVANYHPGSTQPICFMRVRPLFLHEGLKNSSNQVIDILDRESLIFTTGSGNAKEDLMNLTREKLFRCHRTIPPDQTNFTFFTLEFPRIIESLLMGVSHAFLGIGGSGSGKTHSIFGTLSDPGLLLHFIENLFNTARKHSHDSTTEVHVSFMKFKDDFYDLLCPASQQPLALKPNKAGVSVPALTSVRVNSLFEFFIYLRLALKSLPSRDINKDNAYNGLPERCHALVSFKILHRKITKRRVQGIDEMVGAVLRSRVAVVNRDDVNDDVEDRQSNYNEQVKFVEEEEIFESEMLFVDCDHIEHNERVENKQLEASLIALENVMQYVYEINEGLRSITTTHLPYDSSKFTMYLKNYLFGKHQLIVFGTLSPFKLHQDDSAKTARLVQWAFKSRNNVQSNVTQGALSYEKIPVREVGFIRRIHHQTNVLGDEMRFFVGNLSIRKEEKLKYCPMVQLVLREQQKLLLKNHKIVRQCFDIRTQLEQTRREYLHTYFESVRQCVKSSEIRELYLIRFLWQPTMEIRKKMQGLQSEVDKLISKMNGQFSRFVDMSAKFKELLDGQSHTYRSQLRPSHFDAIHELGVGCAEFIRWSQATTIRSFCEINSYRMDMWVNETTSKILSFIDHLIARIDSSGISAAESGIVGFSKLRRQQSSFKRIPSEMALRSLKTIQAYDVKIVDVKEIGGSIDSEEEIELSSSAAQTHNHFRSTMSNGSFQFQRDLRTGHYIPLNSNLHATSSSINLYQHNQSLSGRFQSSSSSGGLRMSTNEGGGNSSSNVVTALQKLLSIQGRNRNAVGGGFIATGCSSGENVKSKSILMNSSKDVSQRENSSSNQQNVTKSVFFVPSEQSQTKFVGKEVRPTRVAKVSKLTKQTSFEADIERKNGDDDEDDVTVAVAVARYSIQDLNRIQAELSLSKQKMKNDRHSSLDLAEKQFLKARNRSSFDLEGSMRDAPIILQAAAENNLNSLGVEQQQNNQSTKKQYISNSPLVSAQAFVSASQLQQSQNQSVNSSADELIGRRNLASSPNLRFAGVPQSQMQQQQSSVIGMSLLEPRYLQLQTLSTQLFPLIGKNKRKSRVGNSLNSSNGVIVPPILGMNSPLLLSPAGQNTMKKKKLHGGNSNPHEIQLRKKILLPESNSASSILLAVEDILKKDAAATATAVKPAHIFASNRNIYYRSSYIQSALQSPQFAKQQGAGISTINHKNGVNVENSRKSNSDLNDCLEKDGERDINQQVEGEQTHAESVIREEQAIEQQEKV